MEYTAEQIEVIPAGRQLDSLVQTHLFNKPAPKDHPNYTQEGCTVDGWMAVHVGAGVLEWWPPKYSTTFELAWKAANRSEGKVILWKLSQELCEATALNALNEQVNPSVEAPTPALAICRAVLMTCFL